MTGHLFHKKYIKHYLEDHTVLSAVLYAFIPFVNFYIQSHGNVGNGDGIELASLRINRCKTKKIEGSVDTVHVMQHANQVQVIIQSYKQHLYTMHHIQ